RLCRQRCAGHEQGQYDEGYLSADHGGSPESILRGYARDMSKTRAKDINQAVREVCLWFPESAEVLSHGSPDFRVRGKTFATYVVNHHGDGRVALWLNAPAGAQELYTKEEPKHFFVPPYVGPRLARRAPEQGHLVEAR